MADRLTDEEWATFAANARDGVIRQIRESAMVFVPLPTGEPDIRAIFEVGAAVMLDKPLLVVAWPDSKIPENLRKIATKFVYGDPMTEEGSAALKQAVEEMLADDGG